MIEVARALRRVVGGRLKQSGLGQVWKDDRTWVELANELVRALSKDVVVVNRKTYERLEAEARQMGVVRKFVEDYKARLPEARKAAAQPNAYARWAAENVDKK